MIVDLAQAFGRQAKPRPSPVVSVVAIWDDRVQSVVCARQFDHDEDAFTTRGLGRLGGRAEDDWRRRPAEQSETGAEQRAA